MAMEFSSLSDIKARKPFSSPNAPDAICWRETTGRVFEMDADGEVSEVTDSFALMVFHAESELGLHLPPGLRADIEALQVRWESARGKAKG